LDGHRDNRGPVNTGSQPFPNQFVFPSGKVCCNFDQLALACHENWKETQELLQQGFLETFLGGLGRTDLALAAREAARNPDRDRGMDQFLSQLPSEVVREPKLAVEPTQVNLGRLSNRANRQFELHLYNQGMRLLYGSVTCDTGVWLALGEAPGSPRKVFQFSSELVIPVQVRGQYLQASSKPLEGRLLIESNGGREIVLVRAEIPAQPFPGGVLAGARSPRQIAEKARTQPKAAAALFQNGAVAEWYKTNGWTYPVQGPVATGVAAVQQFFEALGLTPAPRVEVTPPSVALYGQPGDPARFTLHLRTQEKRPIYASAACDQPWLHMEPAQLQGRSAILPFLIPHVPDCEGELLQATVTVTANGNQRFAVPVTLEVGSHFRFSETSPAPLEASDVSAPMTEFQFGDQTNEEEPSASGACERSGTEVITDPARQPSRRPRLSLNYRQLRHGVPALVLAMALALVMAWDFISPPKPIQSKESTRRNDPRVAISDPFIAVQFLPEKRRFGLQMAKESDPNDPEKPKRLTFDPAGATNNACIKIGNEEHLFGQLPGKWAFDREKKKRLDLVEIVKGQKWQSVMDYDEVRVTRTVAIYPNEKTLKFDTCLVHYLVENRSNRPQAVGVRMMLDIAIGANHGVSFQIPGTPEMLDTLGDFKQDQVPETVWALERSDPQDPGTIAHVGLKLPGFKLSDGDPELDRIERVVICQWNNSDVRWEWTFKPMESNPETKSSCIVVYGPVELLEPGGKRAFAFTYGLGRITNLQSSELELSVDRSSIRPGQEFRITASAKKAEPNQRMRIHLPEYGGFSLIGGQEEEQIAAKGTGQASWKVQAGEAGSYHFVVTSGLARGDQDIEIRKPSGFR
jgi:hypothetical protein